MGMFKKKKRPKGLNDVVKELGKLTERMERAEAALARLDEEALGSLRKVGLVRYDAFSKAGGRQSFSLALLDERRNGVVVTGLFKEGSSRVFVKDVVEGASEFNLSPEEEQALEEATHE